jgi:hypothetical protein
MPGPAAAGQFANDHEIEPIDEFALQRRGIRERAQIGEEVHILAKPQKTRLGARDIGEIARMRRVKKTSGGIHLL